jgi:hypothetical protein
MKSPSSLVRIERNAGWLRALPVREPPVSPEVNAGALRASRGLGAGKETDIGYVR